METEERLDPSEESSVAHSSHPETLQPSVDIVDVKTEPPDPEEILSNASNNYQTNVAINIKDTMAMVSSDEPLEKSNPPKVNETEEKCINVMYVNAENIPKNYTMFDGSEPKVKEELPVVIKQEIDMMCEPDISISYDVPPIQESGEGIRKSLQEEVQLKVEVEDYIEGVNQRNVNVDGVILKSEPLASDAQNDLNDINAQSAEVDTASMDIGTTSNYNDVVDNVLKIRLQSLYTANTKIQMSQEDEFLLNSITGCGLTLEQGERFPCPKCPRFYKSKKCLRRHLSIHDNRERRKDGFPGTRKTKASNQLKLAISGGSDVHLATPSSMYQSKAMKNSTGNYVCQKCGKPYLFSRSFKKHVKTCVADKLSFMKGKDPFVISQMHFERGRGYFKCIKCSRTYLFRRSFIKHKLTCVAASETGDFKCEKCGKMYICEKSFLKHETVCLKSEIKNPSEKESEENVSLIDIKMDLISRKELIGSVDDPSVNEEMHSVTHKEGYRCDKCGKTYLFRRAFSKHKLVCLNTQLDDISDIACNATENLDFKFNVEKGRGNFKCHKCCKTYLFQRSFLKHRKMCSLRPQSETVFEGNGDKISNSDFKKESIDTTEGPCQQQLKCKQCGIEFLFRSSFRKHIKRCLKSVSEKAPEANMCSSGQSEIIYKKKIITTKNPSSQKFMYIEAGRGNFKCKNCGKTYRFLLSFHKHKESCLRSKDGSSNTEYKCQCGKMFSRRSRLETCLRSHISTKPYPCMICGKSYGTRITFKVHMDRFHARNKVGESVCKESTYKDTNIDNTSNVNAEPPCSNDTSYTQAKEHSNLEQNSVTDNLQATASSRVRKVKRTLEDVPKVKGLSCSKCPAKFKSVSSLVRHSKWHEKHKKSEKKEDINNCPKRLKMLSILPYNYMADFAGPRVGQFKCDKCGKMYRFRRIFRRHTIFCKSDKSVAVPDVGVNAPAGNNLSEYKCECGKTYSRRSRLETCLRSHNPEAHSNCYSCSTCAKPFEKEKALTLHRKQHDTKKSQCKFCPTEFATPKELFKHLKLHKKVQMKKFKAMSKVVEGKQKLQCFICVETFAELSELKVHVLADHKEPYECPHCGKHFTKVVDFATHTKFAHLDAEGQSVLDVLEAFSVFVQEWKCEECDLQFEGSDSLVKHQTEQHSPTDKKIKNTEQTQKFQFRCGVCQQTFGTLKQLTTHRDACHTLTVGADSAVRAQPEPPPPNMCVHCRKICKDAAALTSHSRLHSMDRKYPCKFCELRFATLEKRKNHALIHTGDMKFVCFVCEYCCSSENRLNIHKQTQKHLDNKQALLSNVPRPQTDRDSPAREAPECVEKSSTCDVCGEEFPSESAMARHKETHPFIVFPNEEQPTMMFFK